MNFSYPPVLVLESINTKLFEFFNYVNTLTKTKLKTLYGIIIVIFQTTRQTPDKALKYSKDPSEMVGLRDISAARPCLLVALASLS